MEQFKLNLSTVSGEPDIDPSGDEPIDVDPSGDEPIDDDPSQITPQPTNDETEQTITNPDTGYYTQENSALFNPALLFIILAAIIATTIFLFKRFSGHHQSFQTNRKFNLSSKKNKIITVFIIAISVFFIFNVLNQTQKTDPTIAASNDEALSITTESVNLDIKREQGQSAFDYVQNNITVNNSTDNGYTLGIYATNTDLTASTDSSAKVSMISSNDSALEQNTWGISTEIPFDQFSETWNPLPTSQDNPFVIKSTDQPTPTDDTTTVYYGAYIDANLPDGEYSGISINYYGVANIVTPDALTLSFNANKGTGAPSQKTCTPSEEGASCSVIIPTTIPTRNGYDFLGWADTATATTATYRPNTDISISSNKTIYAVWAIQTRTLTLSFSANGGSNAPSSQTCTIKGTSTKCTITIDTTVPTRNGYTFAGWAESINAATIYQPGSKIEISADKTLLALWRIKTNTFTLSYDHNGAMSGQSDQTCNVTGTTTSCTITISSDVPTRSGYTFLGWADTATATTAKYQPSGNITISANKTIFAVWQIKTKTLTLSFNGNNGSNAPGNQTCNVVGTATKCTITISSTKPTRSGYTFVGWADTATATTAKYQPSGSITISANKTVYAVWRNLTGKIHFLNTAHSNAFLIESNGHYGLIDASEAVYQDPDHPDLSDITKCMSSTTCKQVNVTKVVNYLNKIGVQKLDFVLSTHSHDDHIGGMPLIARNYVNSNTKYYYRTYVTTDDDTGANADWHNQDYHNRAVSSMRSAGATLVEVTNKKPTFTLGDFTIKLLNTEPASSNELGASGLAKNENYNSIAAYITINNQKILITGDMTTTDESKVANAIGTTVDILQMPHHGGVSYTSDSFVNKLKPRELIVANDSFTTESAVKNKQLSAMIKANKNYNANTYVTGSVSNAIIANFTNNTYTITDYNNALNAAKLSFSYVPNQTGEWVKFINDGHTYWAHLNNNGNLDKGWRHIDYGDTTSWFYFFDNGLMATGWQELDYNGTTSWFYFFNGGRMATGWQKISYRGQEQWFYLGNGGRMVTGAQTIDGKNYVFNTSGVCIQGSGCPLNPL